MDWLQLVVLALIQGLTEFLPISSSAHLILPSQVLGWPDQGLIIDIAVHVGTLFAVLLYFWKDVWRAVMGGFELVALPVSKKPMSDDGRLAMLILGTIVSITYIVRYANRAKKDPTKSLLYGLNIHSPFKDIDTSASSHLDLKTVLLLSLFGGTFLFMIIGVAFYGWWLEEMTVLFLIASINSS